jgi:glycosyltransferase involved in cell wall biosynthesis
VKLSEQNISTEFIFVVDGCPEESYEILKDELTKVEIYSKLYKLNRNVGSAQAIKFGMNESNGEYITIMAADLQEPAQLFIDMYFAIKASADWIIFASRQKRNDGFVNNFTSKIYWKIGRAHV